MNIGYLVGNTDISRFMMFDTKATEQSSFLFNEGSRWLTICLVVMFILAALIRRDEIKAPGYSITREYNSAIIARAFYVEGSEKIDSWRRNVFLKAKDQLPPLEPPVTEYLVSLIYRIVGKEVIWYSRYLTILFWLTGGIFLYKVVGNLFSNNAALVSVGYYLFVPMGIKISRSFQPDSLMMMMLLISLYVIVRFFDNPSWRRLVFAGTLTGLTLLFRPLVIFTIYGVFLALSISKKKKWINAIDSYALVFSVLSVVPSLIFYAYGIFIGGYLQGQTDLSFRPHLLIRWEFWQSWFLIGTKVAGHNFVIFAFLGLFLIREKLVKDLVFGLVIGYIIFGLVFNYHVSTHDYYHIQLFPIVSICVAPLLIEVGSALKRLIGKTWWIPVIASLLIAMYFSYQDVRNSYYVVSFEDPSIAKEIGELVDHSSKTVFVAYHYGLPLEYYGEMAGVAWPVSIDDPLYKRPGEREQSVQERINSLGFVPDYYVITNFDLYNRKHQDLKAYLDTNCVVQTQTDQYQIYGSCLALSNHDTPTVSPARNGN